MHIYILQLVNCSYHILGIWFEIVIPTILFYEYKSVVFINYAFHFYLELSVVSVILALYSSDCKPPPWTLVSQIISLSTFVLPFWDLLSFNMYRKYVYYCIILPY